MTPTPTLQDRIETYYESVKLSTTDEWPQWVAAVHRATITHNDDELDSFCDWVRDVYNSVRTKACISFSDTIK